MQDIEGSIAIIAPYPFLPASSGGHKAILGYVKSLLSQFTGFVISANENEKAADFELIPCFPDKPWKYFSPVVALRIRRILRERKSKVLVLQHHYMGFILFPFLIGLGIQTFVFSHNIEYRRWRSIGKWWWPFMYVSEWWVYLLANHVCFISLDEKEEAPALFGISPDKCMYAPYLIETTSVPKNTSHVRQKIIEQYDFDANDKLFLFFGPQSYAPNLEAVEYIVFKINPILQQQAKFSYKILICGGGLPKHYQNFESQKENNIHYLGFVEDIEAHVLASDLVLNPVNSGGGVKTKLVEAVGMGKTVISTEPGAKGLSLPDFEKKLLIVDDTNWKAFVEAILAAINENDSVSVSDQFYDTHSISENSLSEIVNRMKSALRK